METTWVLIANGSEARLYATDPQRRQYTLIEQFLHPLSRQKEQAMTSDHASHRETRTDGTASQRVYGSFPEPTDPKEFEIDRFARDLAGYLDNARTENRYHELVVVAPPRFHGFLNRHLDKHVARMISRHVEKDYTDVPERDLPDTLAAHLAP